MTTTKCILRSKKLVAGLSAALALLGLQTAALASVLSVTSCADDNSSGTLRQVAAGVASGDEIDLSQLACTDSTITLTQGEIVLQHNASLLGPADHSLTIVGDGNNRILHSTSSDTPSAYLDIMNLNISGGRMYTKSADASGGCIFASGDVTLTGSTVTDCAVGSMHAVARGGAIYAQSVNLASSRVTGSWASTGGDYQIARGGGIYATSLACTDSTLSGNGATASTMWFDEGGGALIAGGDVNLFRCTVDSNTSGQGGGIMQFAFSDSLPQTTIKDSTISGNSASTVSGGISVFCPDCTPNAVHVLNSTIAFNTATYNYSAAGISTNGDVIAQSSIIANNQNTLDGAGSENADLTAASLSGANNLIVSTDTTYGTGVITFTSDPQLQALADNGGLTQTHALSTTSPALNQGNNSAGFTTDQRYGSFHRMLNGATDIGSYQHQSN